MIKLTIFGLLVSTAIYAAPAPPPPPPPSAVIFSSSHTFRDSADVWLAPVNVPGDGAWLTLIGTTVGSYMDCYHRYAADLTPNFSLYGSPFFQLGTGQGREEACLNNICFSCYTHWGGQPTYTYHTTTTNPGFLPAGSGVIGVRSLTGGGTGDSLYLNVAQINRDAMQSVTAFFARDDDDPIPMQQKEIDDAYYIASSDDRVPVVLEFHYGTDSFPAGPGLTYSATWDNGAVVVPEYNPGPLMPLGYSILGVQIPKLPTGKHKFTIKATLPSGTSYTTPAMEVMVYAQNIYITVEGTFIAKKPVDQAPQFVPGSTLAGADVDLVTQPQNPQMIQLNILIGRGAKNSFDVKITPSRLPGIAMNYPAGATDNDPDIDFGGGLTELTGVPIPNGGAPKVVKLPLYVHDYGASCTIEVTMPYRKTKFIARQTIPFDKDKNGLPDAGWKVGPSLVAVDSSALTSDEDLDADPPASGAPHEGILGDGLTAFEEYRGVVVGGAHERLDPSRKDLFIVADADVLVTPFNGIIILKTLPQVTHFVNFDEVQMNSNSLDPVQDKIRPVINSNRAGIAGATEQRAIRIRSRLNAPLFQDISGQDYPGHLIALGYTWRDGEDLATIYEKPTLAVSTPNGTQVVEVYPAGFDNFAIAFGGNNTPDSIVDPYGNPVVYCANEATDIHCVVNDIARHVLRRPFQEVQLYAVASGDDYYTKFGWIDCPLFVASQVMTPAQFQQTHTVVVGHEAGHALRLPHQNSDCTGIMYTLVIPPPPNTNQSPIRHPITDVLPMPTNYNSDAIDHMRLHEKF